MRSISLTVFALVIACVALAPAADPESDRDQLLQTYDKLVRLNADGGKSLNVADFREVKDTPVGTARNVVKVWAQLSEAEREPRDEYVSVERYRWGKKQRFRLWLQTTTPVYLLLDNVETQPDDRKTYRRLIPRKDDENYPPMIPLAEKYRCPFPLELDDNEKDEEIRLTLVFAPALEKPTAKLLVDHAEKEVVKGRPLPTTKTQAPKTISMVADDVAQVIGMNERSGYAILRFSKKAEKK